MDTSTSRDRFLASLGFEPDAFQVRAFDALDAGRSVLVAAPTGSGKTVVAEYAITRAVDAGKKAFYTTPLKALSNQKYADLVRAHGSGRVGLLTGDNSVNADAPVVVMTTEVLRNMIYAGSPALKGLRYVVLDEVHYLQNPYRGAVWEEVIIHTAPEVDLVCLSATVSNAEEVAGWIQTVRGATTTVIEERRSVELRHQYLVGDRATDELRLLPTFVAGRPNPKAEALDGRSQRHSPDRGGPRGGRLYTPRRAEVAELLGGESMLPAIYFIFSRAACDDAVRQCVSYGLRLTTPEERSQIRAIAESKVEALSDDDLAVLDYGHWLTGLESGVAAHHAGMVPPFKEAVEACFKAALVKVVFATETLSLGINMPARSVVIEKLTKFTGERHEPLSPGDYTQLTGRAGRRGIDDLGFACVLWSPFVPFDQVAGLASRRTYALTSSFRPTYNMAANLVRRYAPDVAHHLLNLSFAQYQADADVVRLEAELERSSQTLRAAEAGASCELGDVGEYRALLRTSQKPSPERAVVEALGRLRPGDVVVVPGQRSGGRAAVLATSQRRGGDVRVTALTVDRRKLSLAPRDFPAPPRALGRVPLPTPYAPTSHGFQRAVAQALARAKLRSQPAVNGGPRKASAAAEHPVADCPDARAHVRQTERAERLRRQVERLERQVRGRTESLARQFDRVLRVLRTWGYVEGWKLTDAGSRLARFYHEADLLIAEALGEGHFDGLDPASLASLASVFTFEQRGAGPAPAPSFPSKTLRQRWLAIERLCAELNLAEEEAGLPLTRQPDPGFMAMAYDWAKGDDLDSVLADDDMSGGDFVRNAKQLIDLLRQLGDVAPNAGTSGSARDAAEGFFRGLVAASSVIGTPTASPSPSPAA
jgi:ATP-dependent RNA helicase HelY